MTNYAERILRAQKQAGLSQRKLGEAAGISQPTLSRIMNNSRIPTVAELVSLAAATGVPFGALADVEQASDRAQFAARATGGTDMREMREALNAYLNLSAFLDDQVIN